MNPLLKKILLGVGIVAVIFVAYRVFFAQEEEAPLSSTTPSGVPAEEGDLLSLLLELKSISLPQDIFSDPAFATLQDFTVTLAPEPIGRRNPFAPIGVGEVAETSTTGSSTEPVQ